MIVHLAHPWKWAVCMALLVTPYAGADTRILLVGVDDYADSTIDDPVGAGNDVTALADVLKKRFGVTDSEVHTLIGRKATQQQILNELRDWLVGNVKPDDQLLFYFSGHGSHVPDLDGDETDDHRDEVLCPADYVKATGENGILDDELGRILDHVPADRLTVIIDACHSGTVTKSIGGRLIDSPTVSAGTVRTRYLSPPSHSTKSLQARTWNTKGITVARDLDHVLHTACMDFQKASATKFLIGGKLVDHGAFTYMLLQALSGRADSDSDGYISHRELDAFVERRLADSPYQFEQRPECLAAERQFDLPFLGRSLTSPLASARLDANGKIRLDRGALDGLSPGDMVHIEVRDRGIGGLARIENSDGLEATATLVPNRSDKIDAVPLTSSLNNAPANVHLQTVPQEQAPGDLRVWIAFYEDDREALPPSELITMIDSMSNVAVVSTAAEADRLIVGSYTGQDIELALARKSETLIKKYSGSLAFVVNELATQIQSEIAWHWLQAIESCRDDVLTLRVKGGQSDFYHSRGDSIVFEVEVALGGYLCLVAVDGEGGGTCLFPNKFERDTHVEKDRKIEVPPPGAAFEFEVLPPAGCNMVKAFWTGQPMELPGVSTKSLAKTTFISLKSANDFRRFSEAFHQASSKPKPSGTKGFVPESTGNSVSSAVEFATATIYVNIFNP